METVRKAVQKEAMNWKLLISILAVVVFSSAGSVHGQLEELKTVSTANLSEASLNTKLQLLETYALIEDMQKRGFNTTRATDTFAVAANLYIAQVALEEKEGPSAANYGEVSKKNDEI